MSGIRPMVGQGIANMHKNTLSDYVEIETGMVKLNPKSIFDCHESEMRSYCRHFPAVFVSAQGSYLTDETGNTYLDFLSGAGTLNYGHNHPFIKQHVLEYLERDGVLQSLDLHTEAKRDLLVSFYDIILKPRRLDYKTAFPGPTGTNAIEAALKLARRATGRHTVIAFTNGFHGMTQGALALSGNRAKRSGAGIMLSGVCRLPYDGYLGPRVDTADLLEKMLSDHGSGLDLPAAIVLETVQGEGGLHTASEGWLGRVAEIARRNGILLVLDDIQTGCGRTGTFFSFEPSCLVPDIVCISKSIGGIGLPLALVLFRPDLDVLGPGQHNGTFRGNNLAFVAATAALQLWRDGAFREQVRSVAALLPAALDQLVQRLPQHGSRRRGRGAIAGLAWDDPAMAGKVSQAAFRRGLIAETSGSRGEVLKLLPPLTISRDDLLHGLAILEDAIRDVVR